MWSESDSDGPEDDARSSDGRAVVRGARAKGEAHGWVKARERWLKARAAGLVVPLGPAQGLRQTRRTGVRLVFDKVLAFQLPAVFHAKGKKRTARAAPSTLECCVHVSLFHVGSKTFFGNTWVSPLVKAPLLGRKSGKLDLRNAFVALHTRLADPACQAVIEIVVVEKDKAGAQILGQYGCGWTHLPLFALLPDLTEKGVKRKVQVYSGSPRALLFAADKEGDPNSGEGGRLIPIEGCSLSYTCALDTQILQVTHLLRENELVGSEQTLPGLKPHEGVQSVTAKASSRLRLLPTFDLYVNSVAALLPCNWEEAVNEYLQLRKGLVTTADKPGRFLLKIAPHNGRNVIAKGGWVQVPLKDMDYGGHPDFDRVLRHTKTTRLKGFCRDPSVALACQIEFLVPVEKEARSKEAQSPRERTIAVVVGCGVWLPFASAGKKIFANTHPRASSTRCPLQFDLQTDMQSPFVDSSVFLPVAKQLAAAPVIGMHLAPRPERVKPEYDDFSDASSDDAVKRRRRGRRGSAKSGSDNDSKGRSSASDSDRSDASDDDSLGQGRRRSRRKRSDGHDEEDADEDVSSTDDSLFGGASEPGDDFDVGPGRNRSRRRHAGGTSSDSEELEADGLYFGPARGSGSRARHSRRSRKHRREALQMQRRRLGASVHQPGPVDVSDGLLAKTLTLKMHAGDAEAVPSKPSQPFNSLHYDPAVSVSNDAAAPASTGKPKSSGLSAPLSRASRTMLGHNGFGDPVETKTRSAPPGPDMPSLDVEAELRDRLKANEITFQFAAFRHVLDQVNSRKPRSVFFTFQFYDGLPTRTERMVLRAPRGGDPGPESLSGLSRPYILTRGGDPKGRNAPSLALKFVVDTTIGDESEPTAFAQYLHDRALFVNVWDGESLLPLGVFAVPLRSLMRQGEKVVKMAQEFDVVAPAAGCTQAGVEDIELYDKLPCRGDVTGKVQLIVTNYGLRGNGPPKRDTAAVEKENRQADWRVSRVFDAPGSHAAAGKSNGPAHRVLARQMATSNPQLEDLIKVAASSTKRVVHPSRREREHKLAIMAGRSEALESEWSFTTNELRRLDKALDRSNRGQVTLKALREYLRLDESMKKGSSKIWDKLRGHHSFSEESYRAFNDADSSNSGTLGRADFKRVLRGLLDPASASQPSEEELEELMSQFKEDSASVVNYERFLMRLIGSKAGDLESKLRRVLRKARDKSGVSLRAAFANHFDVNSDGMLEKDELVQGLSGLGFNPTDSQVALLLQRYGDGRVLRFADFCALAESQREVGAGTPEAGLSSPTAGPLGMVRKAVRVAENKGVSISEAFERFDKNGDGVLTPAECQQGLADLGIDLTDTQLEGLLAELTQRDDGCVQMGDLLACIATEGAGPDVSVRVRKIVLKAKERGLKVRDTFKHLDKDSDGRLSRAECERGLKAIGVPLSSPELDMLFEAMDMDGDGGVDLDEFMAFLMQSGPPHGKAPTSASAAEKSLRAILRKAEAEDMDPRSAFTHFDKDDTGRVALEDFGAALRELGLKDAAESEIEALARKFDKNSDGWVSYGEFLAFCASDPESTSELAKQRKRPDSNAKGIAEEEESKSSPSGANTRPSTPSQRQTRNYAASEVLVRLQRILRKARTKGAEVTDAFDFFDKDASASISPAELEEGLDALGFKLRHASELGEIVSFFDTNGDGSVDLQEFRAFVDDALPPMEDRDLTRFVDSVADKLKKRCRRHDRNDDGTVSVSRFTKLVQDMGWEHDVTSDDLEAFELCGQGGEQRIEYERLGSDLIRNKMCKAVERALSRGINVGDLLAARDRGRVGKLSIHDLHKLVVDLGFSVLEDKAETWTGGTAGQEVVSRQIARINQLRRSRVIRSDKQGVFDDLLPASGAAPDLSEQASQLDIVKRFREGQKREVVGHLLRSAMTKQVRIHPSFAKASYFEVLVTNPYAHEERFQITISDPELRCITRGDEWRVYRDTVTPAWTGGKEDYRASLSAVEDEMITSDSLELTLDPGETVSVPFVFISFNNGRGSGASSGDRLCIRERDICVRVTSTKHGHTVLLIQVAVVPRPFAVDRVLHLCGASNEYVKAEVRLKDKRWKDREVFVHAVDKLAVVKARDAQVSIKYRASASASCEFHVMLYGDAFHAQLLAIWHVCVQPMERLDFHGVLGQATGKEVIVKGDRFSRRVQCFTSAPGEMVLTPSEPFQLVAGAFNRLQVQYRPLVHTPPGTTKQMQIHMVDADSHELVSAWLVKGTAALPEVTKQFQIELPLHQAAHKKIAYVNPWNEARTFLVRTSDPVAAKAKQPQVDIAPKSKAFIRLWFAASNKPTTRDVLVFINDKDDQNEETLLIRAKYTAAASTS